MIPENITQDHIRQAARRIDDEGVPNRREPREYEVIVDDKSYPIMLIVSWANEFANGYELLGCERGGRRRDFRPQEAKAFLRRKGFQVRQINRVD